MNWNWACEQLLKGEKVREHQWVDHEYVVISDIGAKPLIGDGKTTYQPVRSHLEATDWELYGEPEKWTKEDIRKAKAGIELGLEWVARDGVGSVDDDFVTMYTDKPIKSVNSWKCDDYAQTYSMNTKSFLSVKWEDKEPTRLQDIVKSEVQDE